MPKKLTKATAPTPVMLDENYLFSYIAAIIEKRKNKAAARVSSEIVVIFWEIGHFINTPILGDDRVEYGKRTFPTLSGKSILENMAVILNSRILNKEGDDDG
jgi:hypothetical protein